MFFFMFLFYYGSLCHKIDGAIAGILYPRESESREVRSLDGIWNFKLTQPRDFSSNQSKRSGLRDSEDVIPMPVPSSYNDITVDPKIRNHVGVVWYDRKFFIPESWAKDKRVWLRFGSVSYAAQVFLNGELVITHEIGHLPFKQDVTDYLKYGEENLITVSVDNVLLDTTIPQGKIANYIINNDTVLQQYYSFDFFNYAGIDRPVLLYTTPVLYIDDITVSTHVSNGNGLIYYDVSYQTTYDNPDNDTECQVTLSDKEGNEIDSVDNCTGRFLIPSAKLWWPFLMHPEPGYLYELKAQVISSDGTIKDVYRLPVGIREITWTNTQVLINGKPIYIRGVGKHEDSDIRGKGLDLPVIIKDYNLLKWMGVNTFRTSHYPYAEEIMDLADSMGIMVIDECPSVNTDIFSETLLNKHEKSLTELFQRDKNRPSVIMWSVSNEPRSQIEPADLYFRRIVSHIKSLDGTRPVTIAISRRSQEDRAGQYLDVIAFNRYNSWYTNTGEPEVIFERVVDEAEKWFSKHNKPVLMSEYGADAVAGLHLFPERVWSEEYQVLVLEEHFKAFDYLRSRGFFIGEMIWNFADFETAQTTGRVGGNKKGMFTRQREPKASAFFLRKRYYELAHELDGVALPKDLIRYTSSINLTTSSN